MNDADAEIISDAEMLAAISLEMIENGLPALDWRGRLVSEMNGRIISTYLIVRPRMLYNKVYLINDRNPTEYDVDSFELCNPDSIQKLFAAIRKAMAT